MGVSPRCFTPTQALSLSLSLSNNKPLEADSPRKPAPGLGCRVAVVGQMPSGWISAFRVVSYAILSFVFALDFYRTRKWQLPGRLLVNHYNPRIL